MLSNAIIQQRLAPLFAKSPLQAIEEKNPKAFSDASTKEIRRVINDPKKADVYGSYVYRGQTFPGDIDVREIVEEEKEDGSVQKQLAKIITAQVKKLKNDPVRFFSELKAGSDQRYKLNTDDPLFRPKLDDLYKKGLLTEDEYTEMLKLYVLYVTMRDQDAGDELKEQLRKHEVLRWSIEEIEKGEKQLSDQKITLVQALYTPGAAKIDVHVPVNGKYTELTNFWYQVVHDPNTHEVKVLNVEDANYIDELKKQITKYMRPLNYNPFKAIKRLWGIARATKNDKLLSILTPLFQSSPARLNQIKSEADTIILMLQKNTRTRLREAMPIIKNQIDGWRERMSYIYDIPFQEDETYELLHEQAHKPTEKGLQQFSDELKKLITQATLKFMRKYRLLPIPEGLLRVSMPPRKLAETPFFKQALKIPL